MAEAAKQSESMEDILQSIKRIIEDDSDADMKPAAPAPAAAPAPDVLELTEVIKDDGSVDSLPPLPTVAAKMPPAPAPAPVAAAAPIAPPAPKASKPSPMTEGLVSDNVAIATVAALKPIVEGANKEVTIPHIPSSSLRNGNTVEDLVLEALKPMLKGWLDEHLPLIVQKIVEKEVKRIVTFHKD